MKTNTNNNPNTIQPAISELERAFLALLPLFRLEKEPVVTPVITIQSRGRNKLALGWFSPDRWSREEEEESVPEINIAAESLSRSVEAIAETLLHEMVHWANALVGVEDTSVNQYHNEHFKDRCNSIGLTCSKQGRRGWARTELSDALLSEVEKVKLDPAAFAIFREQEQPGVKPEPKMKRWGCGCTYVRCAVDLEATCDKCGESFELGKEKEPKDRDNED